MRRPTDEQIMVALCCGAKCLRGPNTGYCHRWDFDQETKRIRALLDREHPDGGLVLSDGTTHGYNPDY
jgi:hypothetical protein